MITIDGIVYNVPIISLKRSADFLDKFAERTIDGKLHRELIGVYYNYQIQFGRAPTTATYNALWDKLTEPEEFHTVIVPDEGGTRTFSAYFSNIKDEMVRWSDDGNYFKSLTVNFIARQPARK